MNDNAIKIKSFQFGIRIFRLYKYLCVSKKEYVVSKQLLRSGTAVGALVHEAEHAESKADFKHKLSIAQKEINETIYWLRLLSAANCLSNREYYSIMGDATDIIKLLSTIIKSVKASLEKNK